MGHRMPRDSNGVYSLPAGYEAEQGETILPSQHNPPLEDIATALTGSLPVSGSAPMTGVLRVVDGDASAPGIAFASDPTKGFYLDASGNIVPTAPLLASLIPVGLGPLPWPSNTAPDGWVFDGATYNRADYPDLAAFALAALAGGSNWFGAGNGTTTFTIASVKGRAVVGVDSDGGVIGSIVTLGGTVGAKNKTLAQANLPNVNFAVNIPSGQGPHSHSVSGSIAGIIGNGQSGGEANRLAGPGSISIENATLPQMIGTAASGGIGAAIDIIQPSIASRFIFKA